MFEVADGDDAHHACDELVEDELEGVGNHVAEDDDGGEVDVEGDAHVKEDAHEDGRDAEGNDEYPVAVDVEDERGDGDHEQYDEQDEGDFFVVVEYFVACDFKEHVERHECDEAEEEEACVAADGAVGGFEALVAFGFEGGDDFGGFGGDGFAFGDYELSLADHVGGDFSAREPGVELELCADVVVAHAWREEAVGEGEIGEVGAADEVGDAEFGASVAVEENESVGFDFGEVGGFFDKSDAIDAVESAREATGSSLRESVDGDVVGEVEASAVGGGAVDGVVEERVGTSLVARFVDFGL